jgi:hypothetical protein
LAPGLGLAAVVRVLGDAVEEQLLLHLGQLPLVARLLKPVVLKSDKKEKLSKTFLTLNCRIWKIMGSSPYSVQDCCSLPMHCNAAAGDFTVILNWR